MHEELRLIGLDEREIQIYLNLLKGEGTANHLAETTDIRRTTIYEIIERLKKKGLVTSFLKDKKTIFRAASPTTLLDQLEEKRDKIKRIMPQLLAEQQKTTSKHTIEFFEGKNGIKSAANDMLNYSEILVYGASTIADEIVGPYTANFAQRRVERNVQMRAIIPKDIPEHMLNKKVANVTKIRTMNIFEKHQIAYFIYGTNILIVTLPDHLSCVKIENPILAESQRKIFEKLWQISKKSSENQSLT